MKTAIWLALWTALGATACGGPRLDTRTYELNSMSGDEAARLLSPYVYGDRKDAPGAISYLRGSVTVRETPDNLDKIARVLAEFDRPKPSVRLTFQLIQADGATTTDPAIASVEAELRKLFRFRGYRLLGDAVTGGREGSEVSQSVAGPSGPYRIRASIFEVRGNTDSGSVGIQAWLLAPGYGEVLNTTVTLRAGQTAVLGNAGTSKPAGTLILAVRPELVPN